MPGGNSGIQPEDMAGLLRDPQTGELMFVMPGANTRGVTLAKDILLETALAVLKAKDKLPVADITLKFVGLVASKHVGGLLLTIAISQFSDTALNTALRAIGDTHMRAAAHELELAAQEPTPKGKAYHRQQADGYLGIVLDAARQVADKRRFMQSERRIEAHLTAARIALIKAFLCKEAGLRAASYWAEMAKRYYEGYQKIRPSSALRRYEWKRRDLEEYKKSRAWMVTHPDPRGVSPWQIHLTRRSNAIRIVQKDLELLEPHAQAEAAWAQQFYELYQRLVA